MEPGGLRIVTVLGQFSCWRCHSSSSRTERSIVFVLQAGRVHSAVELLNSMDLGTLTNGGKGDVMMISATIVLVSLCILCAFVPAPSEQPPVREADPGKPAVIQTESKPKERFCT